MANAKVAQVIWKDIIKRGKLALASKIHNLGARAESRQLESALGACINKTPCNIILLYNKNNTIDNFFMMIKITTYKIIANKKTT